MLTGRCAKGLFARMLFPSSDRGIDVQGIYFDRIANSADLLRRSHRGTAPTKVVESEVAARGTVENGVGNHRHRFHRRMEWSQIAFACGFRQCIPARIAPEM